MQVINKKNKYFIGAAVFLIAIFSYINHDYYSTAALLCVLLSVLTTFDEKDATIKRPRLFQTINLAGLILAAAIWLFKLYGSK